MNITACDICYGKGRIQVSIPQSNLIGYYKPKGILKSACESSIISEALKNPIGLPPLAMLAKAGQKVAIVVDDNTRPTPTHIILPFIFFELHAAGIRDEDITIVFANGSHRQHTLEEKIRLLGGKQILKQYRVLDHDAYDIANLKYLGRTLRGTPVHINRYVAEADLRVLTGLIKPHSVAGYSGGGKSILPGVSSIETIISDHNYEATDHPNSVLGVIKGNPIRSDIEEAAHLVSPSFILNVILDEDKRIVKAVAGDMIEAHRKGTKMLDELVCIPVPEVADIVIAGCSYPTSVNLYQSANAVLNCTKLVNPIINKGGIMIVASPCSEGIGGEGCFHELMREGNNIKCILNKISQPGFFLHDQWAVQLWASALMHCDVFLVSDGLSPQLVKEMKASPYESVIAALKEAVNKKGENARITVLSDAPYIIPRLVM